MKTEVLETITLQDYYGISLTHVKGCIDASFWDERPHAHEHCEVFVHLSGKMSIFVEKNLYHLTGNEIRLYSSDELHYGKADDAQNMEWFQISIPADFLREQENRQLSGIFFDREPGTRNVFVSKVQTELVTLLNEVFALYHEKNCYWPLYGKSTVLRILCLLNEEKNRVHTAAERNEVLQQILDVINENFRTISTVEDLASMTLYSSSYIYKIFKQYLNITPYRFLLDKKLKEAQNALQNGCSLTQACEASGFGDYNHFITLFRKRYQMTPKKYQVLYAVTEDKK